MDPIQLAYEGTLPYLDKVPENWFRRPVCLVDQTGFKHSVSLLNITAISPLICEMFSRNTEDPENHVINYVATEE